MTRALHIDISRQLLFVTESGQVSHQFNVSTSRWGTGEQQDSFCTPRGRHIVRAKIGAGLPSGACLVGRRPSGEIYSRELGQAQSGRDWILTRILWLSGCEVGRNRLGNVDTMRRYIYIHGTPDTEAMGVPFSHGCIRMRNEDVIELFDLAFAGMACDLQP